MKGEETVPDGIGTEANPIAHYMLRLVNTARG